MKGYLFLDFNAFAEKLLTIGEREVLEGLKVSLYIDQDNGCQIYQRSYISKVQSVEKTIEQERVMHKFIDQLQQDGEIQSLLGRSEQAKELVGV